MAGLFSTHPPIEERVRRLRADGYLSFCAGLSRSFGNMKGAGRRRRRAAALSVCALATSAAIFLKSIGLGFSRSRASSRKPRCASGSQLIKRPRPRSRRSTPRGRRARRTSRAARDVALIDVREQHEWEQGHIPGAVHVPAGYLETRIEEVVPDRRKRVILYCRTGQRSALAANTLRGRSATRTSPR